LPEADAIARLKDLGAHVVRSPQLTLIRNGERVATRISISFNNTNFSAAELQNLQALRDYRHLFITVRGNTLTDEGVARLKVLTNLTRLSLFDTSVTDWGIGALHKALPHLSIFRDGGPFVGVAVSDKNNGCIVRSVIADSPAAKTGIQKGDVVAKFGGQAVGSRTVFLALVSRTSPGDIVAIEVIRENEPMEFQLKIGTLPEIEAAVQH
jgi:predicted metalloprotease with PDZ domain